jgi:hypothetical protein
VPISHSSTRSIEPDGVARLDGLRHAVRPGHERGQVDRAALLRVLDGVRHQMRDAIDVRRAVLHDRDVEVAHDLEERPEPARLVADVHVQDAALAAETATHVAVGRDARDLGDGGHRRAPVGDRQLADSDHLVDQHEIAPDAAGQRGRRHVVRARPHERRKPFGLQRADFGRQRDGRPRRAVGPGDADDRGDAPAREVGQHRLGPARDESAAAPAARDVDVLIDEARHHAQPGDVAHGDAVQPREGAEVAARVISICDAFLSAR